MGFDRLIEKARAAVFPRQLSIYAEAGGVGAAIEAESGRIYIGVCIDTACSMGFCAEHAAAAAMVTAGENRIVRVVAVDWDGSILPPCGRCREFMLQLHDENIKAEVLVNAHTVRTLQSLVPYDWRDTHRRKGPK